MSNFDNLLGDIEFLKTGEAQRDVSLSEIIVLEKQVRSPIDVTTPSFVEFANSIRDQGVNTPVLLRLMDDDTLVLVAGERRYKASQMAGFETIPAIIKTMTDEEFRVKQITENIHREELSQLDLAVAINEDYKNMGNDLQAVADKYKKSKAWVSQLVSAANPLTAASEAIKQGIVSDVDVVAGLNTIEKKYGPEEASLVVDAIKSSAAQNSEPPPPGEDSFFPTEPKKQSRQRDIVRSASQKLKAGGSARDKTIGERAVDFIYSKQKKGTAKIVGVWLINERDEHEDEVSALETELRTIYDKGRECKSPIGVMTFFNKTENFLHGQGLLRAVAFSIGLKNEEFSLENVLQTAVDYVG